MSLAATERAAELKGRGPRRSSGSLARPGAGRTRSLMTNVTVASSGSNAAVSTPSEAGAPSTGSGACSCQRNAGDASPPFDATSSPTFEHDGRRLATAQCRIVADALQNVVELDASRRRPAGMACLVVRGAGIGNRLSRFGRVAAATQIEQRRLLDPVLAADLATQPERLGGIAHVVGAPGRNLGERRRPARDEALSESRADAANARQIVGRYAGICLALACAPGVRSSMAWFRRSQDL